MAAGNGFPPRPGAPRPGEGARNAFGRPLTSAHKPPLSPGPARQPLDSPSFARPASAQAPSIPATERAAGSSPSARPSLRPRRRSIAPLDSGEPSVLLVGEDARFGASLAHALQRHGVYLETALPAQAVEVAVVAAPDLIVLAGAAAEGGGRELLSELARRPDTSVIPVALVQDDTRLDTRLKAFRHGAAAILPRRASVDELAHRVAQLAREIPTRNDETLGELGEVTLEELVHTLGAELRSGILSVADKDGQEAVRLVLGGGRPLAKLIEEFVAKARSHVVSAEPLRYEFDARAGGTVQLLDASQDGAGAEAPRLDGLRVVLADSNAGRSDAVSQELRHQGAEVIVCDLSPTETRLAQMRQADPAVLLIGEEHLQADGYELVRRMRHDTRLRWTSLLVVRWGELWRDDATAPVERLASTLATLSEPERALLAQTCEVEGFDTRLEIVGPARTLRSLANAPYGLRVQVNNPRLHVELDLESGLVVGALARTLDASAQTFEGADAIAALLQVSSGRVQVDRAPHPARANVMATVDMALNLTDGEAPPIQPSIPVAAASTPGAPVIAPPTRTPVFADDEDEALEEIDQIEEEHPLTGPLGEESAPPLAATLLTTPTPSLAAPPFALSPTQRPVAAAPAAAHPPVAAPRALRDAPGPAHLPLSAAGHGGATTMSAPLSFRLLPSGFTPTSLDERLRALFGVDVPTQLPSPGLLALLGALTLAQLAWILVVISASTPPPVSQVTPLPDASTPVAALAPPSSAQRAAPRPGTPHAAQTRDAHTATSDAPRTSATSVAAAPVALPVPDGSGRDAPTCDSVLGAEGAQGEYPGAAYDQAQKGKKALIAGRLAEAHERYCRAARWDTSSPTIWLTLAQVFLLYRDGDQAVAAAERGYKLNPDDFSMQTVLADALARAGDVERARALWKRGARLQVAEPTLTSSLAQRDELQARQAIRRGDHVYAERMFRRVALLQPDRADGSIGLARELLALKDPTAALRWADYAVYVEPGRADTHVTRGDVLDAQGHAEAARAEWATALRLDPAHPAAQARLR